MALDPALVDAVREATASADHPEAVAKRLLAWLTHMSDGELTRDASAHFYEDVRNALSAQGDGDED